MGVPERRCRAWPCPPGGDHRGRRPVEPFLARVVDVVDGPGNDSVVHLDVPGVPDQTIEELRHAGLLSA
ncbi:MAG: hypothetical protein OEW83_19630 [Acidimicrobiia bacterium]|nr:hypothetical protein [Acidimicrobiia bacterium]